jgi:DNA-binding transcriptional regulator YiaG
MKQSHRFLARDLKMSGIMKEISQQMTGMSKMMTKGTASEKEMKSLQDKMMRMQKEMSEIETNKIRELFGITSPEL